MKDYVKRMLDERDELKARIDKAQRFLDRNAQSMNTEDKELLVRQVQIMWEYYSVLELRLAREGIGHGSDGKR